MFGVGQKSIIQTRGGGGKKLFLFTSLAMRHSGAGQPRVRSGKQTVAKGKADSSFSNGSYRRQNRGFYEFAEYDLPKD